MITESDFESISNRLKNITEQEVTIIEDESLYPPTLDELEDNNKTYSMMVAILFIDIRKSTYLTENSSSKSMVKVYRSFMRMTVDCVRKCNGVTRQFMGDRIMGVFKDTYNKNGTISESAVTNAVNAARCMQTLLDYSLNRHLNNNVNGKIIECGIGIDYGKILVTKAGMYGIESDESKENEMSFIWVGNATNHASKYADLTDGGEIFISEMAYTKLSSDLKKFSWSSITKFKGIKSYNGYSIHDFYLDFKENLETPLKMESDNESHNDNAVQLSDGIKIIFELQDKLFNKERNLTINEVNLKKENEAVRQVQYELDGILYDIIHSAFMDKSIVKKDDIKYWLFVINNYYIIEKCLGRSKADTRVGISYCLSSIYDRLGLYKQSFEEMSYMANNASWINMPSATLNWAKEKGMIWDIRYDINRRIESDSSIDRQSFQSYYDEVDKYYG